MKVHSTKHCTGTLLEHPRGDLLRLTMDGRDVLTLDAEECRELREILNQLQPQARTIKPEKNHDANDRRDHPAK